MRHRPWFVCGITLLFTLAAGAQPVAPAFKLPVPAEVRALGAAVGLGRQRLALVISQPNAAGLDLPASTRDAQAVAAALSQNGYVVMRRDDVGAAALRGALQEFRSRLTPRAAALVYVAGAGAQVDGQSLLITRDLRGAAQASPQVLRETSLPLAEVIAALQITPGSLRLLVVDAAPPLPDLPPAHRGLATPVLPEGVMALLSAQPGQAIAPLRPPPLPAPTPTDPRALAGSPFGTALVHALTTAGVTGPDALRDARRLAQDGTAGRLQPWLGGRTDEDDSLGDPDFTAALLQRLPEDLVVAAVQRAAGLSAEDLATRTGKAPADPAAQPPEGPGASTSAGTVAGVVGAGLAVAGMVGGAAAEAQAAQAAVVAGAAATATDLALDAARQAAGAAVAPGGAPPAQHFGSRSIDQREAVDGPSPVTAAPPAAVPTSPPAMPPVPPAFPVLPTGSPPTTNPYGYAAGDEFTYQRFDEWKGEMVGLVVQLIRRLGPDGELEARENDADQLLDPQGRTRRRSGPAGVSVFEPVEQFWWPDAKPGDSRDIEFTETFRTPDGHGERAWEGEVEVGEPEWLQTPAGRFKVVPMVGDGWYHEINRRTGVRRSVMWERTVWFAPELGHPVAMHILERDANSRRLRKERLELLHAQNSRTVPR